jgi:type II secretory pathway pseudopilin PulG
MKIRRTGKYSENGTTLVDVILAVAIVAIMAGGLIGSLSYGFYTMQMARENQRATQIMLEKTEAIRLYNWTQVTNAGFIPNTFTDVYDPQGGTSAQGVVYSGTVTKSSVPFSTSYSPLMIQVKIDLAWNTRAIHRTRSLTTYIAKDGVQNYVY